MRLDDRLGRKQLDDRQQKNSFPMESNELVGGMDVQGAPPSGVNVASNRFLVRSSVSSSRARARMTSILMACLLITTCTRTLS